MNNPTEVREILSSLGYALTEQGHYFRSSAMYRNGNNRTSLSINKHNGYWHDWVTQQSGDLEALVKLTVSTHGGNAEDFLKNFETFKKTTHVKAIQPQINLIKTFPKDILTRLIPHYDFYINKGISIDTLKQFQCGLAMSGKMYNRIVFPIFNEQKNIIGFSGRSILNPLPNSIPKWKHIGQKNYWIYPFFINQQFINEKKEVILVESIGDMLALWESDIKNVLCLFGTRLSQKLLSTLISLSPNKIIISTNDDKNNKLTGNKAADHIKQKLNKYFHPDKILIKLPLLKDFGEMSKTQIHEWNT